MVVPSTLLEGGSAHPISVLSIGSKLPLPLYADVRLHTTMTHRNDVIRYGENDPTKGGDDQFDETKSAMNPTNPYAATKAAAEMLCNSYVVLCKHALYACTMMHEPQCS